MICNLMEYCNIIDPYEINRYIVDLCITLLCWYIQHSHKSRYLSFPHSILVHNIVCRVVEFNTRSCMESHCYTMKRKLQNPQVRIKLRTILFTDKFYPTLPQYSIRYNYYALLKIYTKI